MDRGYLYLLIGALLMASTLFPFNINIPFFSIEFFGYLLILMGIREMRTSAKELKNAFSFAVVTLALRFILRLFPIPTGPAAPFYDIFPILNIFFAVGIFFWLFKAEYMWSPHTTKRIDWLMYSIVALIRLVIYGIITFPTVSSRILPPNLVVNIFEGFQFVNFLYYAVLIYILVKLYLEARRNSSGLKRWN